MSVDSSGRVQGVGAVGEGSVTAGACWSISLLGDKPTDLTISQTNAGSFIIQPPFRRLNISVSFFDCRSDCAAKIESKSTENE